MTEVVIHPDYLVLDACCIINLAMTGELEPILEAVAAQCMIVTYVLKHEALTYFNAAGEETSIQLEDMLKKGIIQETELDLTNECETDTFVSLQVGLDEGEARSAAIAICRQWGIATDDKRAIRDIQHLSSKTQILTTPELIKYWVNKHSIPDTRLKQAIQAIRRYMPPKNHPLLSWWMQYIIK